MANIVPGVLWRPIDVGNRAARRKGRGLVCHVAVSNSLNLVPGPLASRAADWHFYLPKDGPAIQYIDLDKQCWSTAAANPTMPAFESQGGVVNADGEPWTENQMNWAARIYRHLHDTEGAPYQLMPNSLAGSRGLGYHRLGIDPWRVAGGEVWSSSRGKICPGSAKIAQLGEILRRASGGVTPPPAGGDTYTVVRGDTLWGVSRKFNVTVQNLRDWNGLRSDTLSIGQVLRVKPAAPVPPPAPIPTGGPVLPPWNLPAGHYYGNINGPAQSHGGWNQAEKNVVKVIQQRLIFKGCVDGVPASSWASTGWADGVWEGPTDQAMAEFHRRFYPNQPQPTQCWSDDYAVLAR